MTRHRWWPLAAVLALASRQLLALDSPYTYQLMTNKEPDVCEHMLGVFNTNFSRLWDSEPLMSYDSDPYYGPDSRYAFHRLPGVAHDARATWVMRYSKWPTSPEFAAIDWTEGRATLGPAGEKPIPILVAHFDFDNDGKVDTVAKVQFYSGPGIGELGSGEEEYLVAWRDQILDFQKVPSLWALYPASPQDKPIIAYGKLERPFAFKGRTYVATYGGDESTRGKSETMTVLSYTFTGRVEDIAGRPSWDASTVCTFSMRHTGSRGKETHQR